MHKSEGKSSHVWNIKYDPTPGSTSYSLGIQNGRLDCLVVAIAVTFIGFAGFPAASAKSSRQLGSSCRTLAFSGTTLQRYDAVLCTPRNKRHFNKMTVNYRVVPLCCKGAQHAAMQT